MKLSYDYESAPFKPRGGHHRCYLSIFHRRSLGASTGICPFCNEPFSEEDLGAPALYFKVEYMYNGYYRKQKHDYARFAHTRCAKTWLENPGPWRDTTFFSVPAKRACHICHRKNAPDNTVARIGLVCNKPFFVCQGCLREIVERADAEIALGKALADSLSHIRFDVEGCHIQNSTFLPEPLTLPWSSLSIALPFYYNEKQKLPWPASVKVLLQAVQYETAVGLGQYMSTTLKTVFAAQIQRLQKKIPLLDVGQLVSFYSRVHIKSKVPYGSSGPGNGRFSLSRVMGAPLEELVLFFGSDDEQTRLAAEFRLVVKEYCEQTPEAMMLPKGGTHSSCDIDTSSHSWERSW